MFYDSPEHLIALQALARGERRMVDLATLNGQPFHTLCGLGFFSRVARERGANVTCGISINHLSLNENDIGEYRTFFKLSPPLRKFLSDNTEDGVLRAFMSTAKRIWPKEQHDQISKDNMLILVPAFTISELTKAFQVGFLLYLPFIAIDLIISNILLAMGMMMVSPMTISLPFKLLLFVTLDGWLKISQGLLLSYK